MFKLVERGIGLISTIILARLLVPGDFGLVALATAIIAIIELLGNFSFDIALIQRQDASRVHYDTAWTYKVIISTVSMVVLVLIAHSVAVFYSDLRLENIVYLLALSTFFQGFENIGVVAFRKELDFKKEFRYLIVKKLASFSVTVTLAVIYQSYWALVFGILSGNVFTVIISYLVHPYRPRLSLAAKKDLFNFSKWLFLNNIIFFLNNRSADFIIGKIAGAHTLGLFTVAYEISNLPTSELVAPINRAVFPGYAKISGQIESLREGFIKVMSVITLIAFPAGIGILAIADLLIPVFLGDKWLDAIPLIQIMAIFGIFMSITSNAGYVYIAIGKPRIITLLYGVYSVMLIMLLIFLSKQYGALGAAKALLSATAVLTPIALALVMHVLRISTIRIIGIIYRPLVSSLIMLVLILWIKGILQINIYSELALCVLVGAAIYTIMIILLWSLAGKPQSGEKHVLDLLRNRLGK